MGTKRMSKKARLQKEKRIDKVKLRDLRTKVRKLEAMLEAAMGQESNQRRRTSQRAAS